MVGSELEVAHVVARGLWSRPVGGLVGRGERGRRALKAALFGSVSSALSRASDRPVVIVRPDAHLPVLEASGERSRIVCGVDDSPHARGTATVAAALAAALDAELVLVHAYSPTQSA